MLIDSLTSTEVYVERKTKAMIVGNSSVNSAGILEMDSFGNKLVSNIDSGDTELYRLSKYMGEEGLMLYNVNTKYVQIAKEGDMLNIKLDFEKGTRYYIGAKLLKTSSKTGNSFDVALDGRKIFKVFLDGRELKSYSTSDNKITVLGADVGLLDIFSELVVYSYSSKDITAYGLVSQRNEGETGTKLIFERQEFNVFEIEYDQYDCVWKHEEFMDGSYFETMRGKEITCFESLSISQNVSKTVYRGGFSYSNKTRVNSVDNTMELEMFDSTELVDMVQWADSGEFRVILANPLFGRCVLVNNCKIDNGVTMVYDKSKNTKKFTISCGNYIDIKIGKPSEYGKERYSRDSYSSSNTWIINSHRKDA
ncbi:MAG: hypothetical protein ACRC0Y_04085 [Fusobacteriaceae bacterium]